MKFFLIKTDPDTYSIHDFARDGQTVWTGVRNPQAVIFLKSMKTDDYCLVYHTQGECTIVGLAKVIGNSRPDPKDPKSWLVDMQYIKTFDEPFITLHDIKWKGTFNHFRLVTQSRLSVMDVPNDVIDYLQKKGLQLP